MKKNFAFILFSILIFYLLFHTFYAIYMLCVAPVSGVIWLFTLMIEILFVFLGYKKHFVFSLILVTSLIVQSVFSGCIMVLGLDGNTKNADYVLVLGYQLSENKMSDTLKYRLDKAYKYAKSNKECKFVLCGGITGSNSVSEADVMYDYLVSLGIEEERLFKEDQSTDTIENIKNSFEYVTLNSKIVLISSNYHVYRAKQICNRLGLEVSVIGSYAPILLYPNQLLFEKLGLIKMLIKI